MKIAIATDGDNVAAHFGRCPAFTLLDIDGTKITAQAVIENPGHQSNFIPRFLYDRGVRCIITVGMGARAVELFRELEMEAIAGINGKVTEVMVSDLKKR
jgi:predicted Fe-Mo cluster-binding NifX family protein